MSHVALFITGVVLVLTTIILTSLVLGLLIEDFSQGMLLLASILLVITLVEFFSRS